MYRIIDLDAEKNFQSAFIPISSLEARPVIHMKPRGSEKFNALTRLKLYSYQGVYSPDLMLGMFLAIVGAESLFAE